MCKGESLLLYFLRSDGDADDGDLEMSAISAEFGASGLQVCTLCAVRPLPRRLLLPGCAPAPLHSLVALTDRLRSLVLPYQVVTIGFGSADEEKLRSLAALGGGQYKSCLQGSDLVQAFKELAKTDTLQTRLISKFGERISELGT